ncbi:hypothetical protein KMB26_18740 [Streptomyces sp. CYG20]|nr:hypothetical protein [Streptomyces sp. COG21]MBT3084499.1 hypothetical protein [Streptomyces sp. COG20]MBT3085406.1 hypothetical protein [Streptomyces sp. CYG21]MBT3098999.1 hypothetical protein [Streptomyces sp. CBG30]MBT3103552.1 hypothetical protein [Streptomyces sp. COG19]MBT3111241.1 hypothetical protein [Streptomyces sp. CYG20]
MGAVVGMVPAFPGLRADVTAPPGSDTAAVPGGGVVVGWVLVADEGSVGGARVDPVFLAEGRAWTPDQFREAHGQHLGVAVRAA